MRRTLVVLGWVFSQAPLLSSMPFPDAVRFPGLWVTNDLPRILSSLSVSQLTNNAKLILTDHPYEFNTPLVLLLAIFWFGFLVFFVRATRTIIQFRSFWARVALCGLWVMVCLELGDGRETLVLMPAIWMLLCNGIVLACVLDNHSCAD